jgi:DNA-binding IclR family transcriptional regulator
MEPQRSDTQQRLLGTMLALADAETPLRLKDIAEKMGAQPTLSLRDLTNLRIAGLASQTAEGNWITGNALLAIGKRLAARELNKILENLK